MEDNNLEKIIAVEGLCRDYKVASKSKNMLQYLFFRKHEIIHAVKDINFDINKGEMVGFVGPNGAGKSTTIKMLAGILVPTGGMVSVLGKDPFRCRKNNAFSIGAVFGQRSQLWWDLPISDTFLLLKKIYHIQNEVYEKNLGLFKKYLDLDGIWHQPVRQLSLGQRMRAEIAVAILHNPPLLFLDEPTIGLDIVAKRQIRDFIIELNHLYGTTVILTSHDMKDIEEVCKRIIIIDKGTVIIDCPMENLQKKYSDSVVVNVRLAKDIHDLHLDMPGIHTAGRHDNDSLSFCVDKTKTSTGHLVYELSKYAEIVDIDIKEQAVEDIIHDIYLNGI